MMTHHRKHIIFDCQQFTKQLHLRLIKPLPVTALFLIRQGPSKILVWRAVDRFPIEGLLSKRAGGSLGVFLSGLVVDLELDGGFLLGVGGILFVAAENGWTLHGWVDYIVTV